MDLRGGDGLVQMFLGLVEIDIAPGIYQQRSFWITNIKNVVQMMIRKLLNCPIYDGGRTIPCTKEFIGEIKDLVHVKIFHLKINLDCQMELKFKIHLHQLTRGFKAGYNIIETNGGGEVVVVNGGSGATGGEALWWWWWWRWIRIFRWICNYCLNSTRWQHRSC